MSNRVYLSLGSNDQAAENLQKSVDLLRQKVEVLAISPVYESLPVGEVAGKATYFNAALLISTPLEITPLKDTILRPIEAQLGRQRSPEMRHQVPIDLDIILFNDAQLYLGQRQIPDPAIQQAAYVAIPLAAIAPDYKHPITGEVLKTIAARFDVTMLTLRPDIILT